MSSHSKPKLHKIVVSETFGNGVATGGGRKTDVSRRDYGSTMLFQSLKSMETEDITNELKKMGTCETEVQYTKNNEKWLLVVFENDNTDGSLLSDGKCLNFIYL